MTSVLKITPAVGNYLMEAARAHGLQDDRSFRLIAHGAHYLLVAAQPETDDVVLSHGGRIVLRLDPAVVGTLEGSSLGIQKGREGDMLVVTTPQQYPFGPATDPVPIEE
jgi:hypothetical protein